MNAPQKPERQNHLKPCSISKKTISLSCLNFGGKSMATAAAAAKEPTILSRVDRLEIMMGYLEEIRLSRGVRSSFASTTSSGTATASEWDGGGSPAGESPRKVEKQPRPVCEAVADMKRKGSLIERVNHLEDRILKLSVQLEEEIESEKEKKMEVKEEEKSPRRNNGEKKKKHSKTGLKRIVKSCVKGGSVNTKE